MVDLRASLISTGGVALQWQNSGDATRLADVDVACALPTRDDLSLADGESATCVPE